MYFSRTFGSHLDIHSGGLDLVFPHHANEILQSTAYHKIKTWAKYWLHSGNCFYCWFFYYYKYNI